MAGSYTGTKAQSGNQTQVSIGSTPTLVGEVSDFTQSGTQNKSEDATNLESTAEEFIPTILTPGKFAGVMNRISGDAGQQAVRTAFTSVPPAIAAFTVQLPKTSAQTSTGDKYTFNALVEEFNDLGKISPTGIIKTQFSLKISGPITFTAGS